MAQPTKTALWLAANGITDDAAASMGLQPAQIDERLGRLKDHAQRARAGDAAPLCAICLESPGTVPALLDEREVLVCRHCFAYETGEIADADEDPCSTGHQDTGRGVCANCGKALEDPAPLDDDDEEGEDVECSVCGRPWTFGGACDQCDGRG